MGYLDGLFTWVALILSDFSTAVPSSV